MTSNPALDRLGDYPLAPLQELAETLRADGGPLYDFSIGDPNEPTPEFIRRALVDAVDPVSRYPTAAGRRELREAVAGWLQRRHGASVDPDINVLPSAGSKEAIFHLPLAVVDPYGQRRHVLWGDPGYPVYERAALFAGGVSDPVTLAAERAWRLELDALPAERLERACIAWVNYPHNPTGAVVDVEYYRRQVETARAYDLLLCSDECYQEIWFDSPAASVLEAVDGDFTGVLAFVSLSKRSGMTGYRCGAIVGDAQVIRRLKLLRPNVGTASPTFVQAAAVAAWSDQTHVEARRRVFGKKRAIILPFLERNGLKVSGSAATFYVWFRAPGGDELSYVEALLRERILTSAGRAFGPGGVGWVRLALVPTTADCATAVERWEEALRAGRLPSEGHGESRVEVRS
ncbi:MAG: succinyldiaminopimelate transaminase [Actinomycetota bacterium]|nr:succinyldiaminopimelate transaminase [Actinomycetota bacterium]